MQKSPWFDDLYVETRYQNYIETDDFHKICTNKTKGAFIKN